MECSKDYTRRAPINARPLLKVQPQRLVFVFKTHCLVWKLCYSCISKLTKPEKEAQIAVVTLSFMHGVYGLAKMNKYCILNKHFLQVLENSNFCQYSRYLFTYLTFMLHFVKKVALPEKEKTDYRKSKRTITVSCMSLDVPICIFNEHEPFLILEEKTCNR